MRTTAIISALLAAGALATPMKRNVVTNYVIITITEVVFYTPPASSPSTLIHSSPFSSPVPSPIAVHSTSTPKPQPKPTPKSPPMSTSIAPIPLAPAPMVSLQQAPSPVTQAPASVPTTIVTDLKHSDPLYSAFAVEHHNVHRTNHSAPAMVYNSTLARWSQTKAESCVWSEDFPPGASGAGMNIAAGNGLHPGQLPTVISNMWYDSEVNNFPAYGVDNLDVSPTSGFNSWGHFSQVVWNGTESVGCGTAACGANTNIGSGMDSYFTVCMYYPPGNFIGAFTQVGKPLEHPTVVVDGNQIIGL